MCAYSCCESVLSQVKHSVGYKEKWLQLKQLAASPRQERPHVSCRAPSTSVYERRNMCIYLSILLFVMVICIPKWILCALLLSLLFHRLCTFGSPSVEIFGRSVVMMIERSDAQPRADRWASGRSAVNYNSYICSSFDICHCPHHAVYEVDVKCMHFVHEAWLCPPWMQRHSETQSRGSTWITARNGNRNWNWKANEQKCSLEHKTKAH